MLLKICGDIIPTCNHAPSVRRYSSQSTLTRRHALRNAEKRQGDSLRQNTRKQKKEKHPRQDGCRATDARKTRNDTGKAQKEKYACCVQSCAMQNGTQREGLQPSESAKLYTAKQSMGVKSEDELGTNIGKVKKEDSQEKITNTNEEQSQEKVILISPIGRGYRTNMEINVPTAEKRENYQSTTLSPLQEVASTWRETYNPFA